MSETLEAVKRLVAGGDFLISEHGYEEMANDAIAVRDAVNGVQDAVVVEDYPTFHRGPSVLVLESDSVGRPIHIVWGIPQGQDRPAVLVTAYRPDPRRWTNGFLARLK